jgi:hypothetical protein
MMKSEAAIQEWVERKLHGGGLLQAITWGATPLDHELRSAVLPTFGQPHRSLAAGRSRAIRDAYRVLQAFIEPEFHSADENISDERGVTLRPDLLLRDVNGGAFVVVELKRDRKAAREFATELLAYANCLRRKHPNATVFLVPVSTSWKPLETYAFAQLREGRLPLLPLQYEESEQGGALRVRTDLLSETAARGIEPSALKVETKTFLPDKDSGPWSLPSNLNRVSHSLKDIAHRAEQETASGFALAWRTTGSDVLLVSVAVHDPCHVPVVPPPSYASLLPEPAPTELDPAFANNEQEYSDDAATRLLLETEVAIGGRCYSSECEGPWREFETRLVKEDASVLGFEAFGDLATRLHRWRALNRSAFSPLVADLTTFPAWHPVTWLPLLDSLLDIAQPEEAANQESTAFRIGEAFGRFAGRYGVSRWRSSGHFGRAAAEARFLVACRDLQSLMGRPLPPLGLVVASDGIRLCSRERWQEPGEVGVTCMREVGEALGAAFAHGYRDGSSPWPVHATLSPREIW